MREPDAARWLILNMNGGELDRRQIVSKAMAREYFTQQSAHPEPRGRIRIEEGFALGWNIGKHRDQSPPYFFHGGGYVGAASYFCFLPNERIGVAVMANTGEGGAALGTIVSIDVLDRLLGVKDQRDLLPVYAEDVRSRREGSGNDWPNGANSAKSPGGLSQPLDKYAGTYIHPLEGELEVLAEHDELTAHIGDLPFVLVSTGSDEFTACVAPGMAQTGSFEVDPDGTVVAVTLASGGTTTRFERVGAKGQRGDARSSAGG